jgi:hypothetical protein
MYNNNVSVFSLLTDMWNPENVWKTAGWFWGRDMPPTGDRDLAVETHGGTKATNNKVSWGQ